MVGSSSSELFVGHGQALSVAQGVTGVGLPGRKVAHQLGEVASQHVPQRPVVQLGDRNARALGHRVGRG